ncbi:PspC domain-containing protein [Gordonia sp. CPCC 205515]|uniref:PspC domain-containing protein n=1 Tax=Gordonia sp. CPCC 205515 TaxID=3140791 RepID=UPI003AF38325
MDTKQLESMWATRPIRPTDGRMAAGVCAGIGARYRVDPTLVRVAFVVATLFGGSGVLLYIAAWLTLPAADHTDELGQMFNGGPAGRPRGHRDHMPHRNGKFVLLVVLAIILVTSFGPNTTWSSGGLVGAALMLLGWWLLYQRTPEPPIGTSADQVRRTSPAVTPRDTDLQRWTPRNMTWPAPPVTPHRAAATTTEQAAPQYFSANPAPAASAAPQAAESATDELHRTPPAWDPLGAAQFAWDLPEPTPTVPPAERERRSPLTLIVLGVAVVVAAAGAAAHQAGVDWFTPARILSLALGVVAVGLVHAGLRRRATGRHSAGLVPVALILAAAVVATTLAGRFDGPPAGGAGERVWAPVSENDIKPEYTLTMGKITLDLREVDLTADRTVEVRNGLGEIHVLVPENMNVRAHCETNVGDYTCPEGLSGGNDGTEGPVLTINAHSSVGNVEVTR